MVNWGYTITRGRRVDIDSNDMSYSRKLLSEFPELQSCIACGSCTATCTAGNLTAFNFRRMHTLVRRGEYREVYEQLQKCMLCGKCRLVCPRGINTRAVALKIRQTLCDY